MTLCEAACEALRALDLMHEVARADAKAMLREHGATDAEITAALQGQEVMWMQERALVLGRLFHELAAF